MSSAWDVFVASLDPVQLELERITRSSVSPEVAAHELMQERFGSRRHREMVWRHEVTCARSKAAIASVHVPVWFNDRQLQIAGNIPATGFVASKERKAA